MTEEELDTIREVLHVLVSEQTAMVWEDRGPLERVERCADAFAHAGFSDEQLYQLLAVAVDRLTIRKIGLDGTLIQPGGPPWASEVEETRKHQERKP